MSKDIYLKELHKSRKMLKKDKLNLELNRYCEYIKIMFIKSNIRQEVFYKELLCPELIKTGIFCHVINKKFVPKSYSTFKKYVATKKIHSVNLTDRKKLVYFLLDTFVRAIDTAWLEKMYNIDKRIRQLGDLINSDFDEPRNITEETLNEYIEKLKKHGLKIEV